MRGKPKAPDPRQARISALRTPFAVPPRDWLPAGNAFTADGRAIPFKETDDPDGKLREALAKVNRGGPSALWYVVCEPDQRDASRMARLPRDLVGGYTLLLVNGEIIAFQMVAFDRNDTEEYESLVALPFGNCYFVHNPYLASWDGTALTAKYEPPDRSKWFQSNAVTGDNAWDSGFAGLSAAMLDDLGTD
jgi:hypothetical protein